MGKYGKLVRLFCSMIMLSRQITVRSFVNWFELEYRGDCRHTKLTAGIRICRQIKQIVRYKGIREGLCRKNRGKYFNNMVIMLQTPRSSRLFLGFAHSPVQRYAHRRNLKAV